MQNEKIFGPFLNIQPLTSFLELKHGYNIPFMTNKFNQKTIVLQQVEIGSLAHTEELSSSSQKPTIKPELPDIDASELEINSFHTNAEFVVLSTHPVYRLSWTSYSLCNVSSTR